MDHSNIQYKGKRHNGGALILTTEINGITYTGEATGGQTFNNGDQFGYFIVNVNDYDNVKNMIKGKVRISITNLSIETWQSKK